MQADNQPSYTFAQTGLIFIIGFMGCGKTTLGRKLANRLGCAFVDLDEVLEQNVGMSIADYFHAHSEAKFRDLESTILKQTQYPAHAIISTGGGLPCFFDHMDWMNQHGKTLYIKLAPKILAGRLESGKADRPVLQGKHGNDLIKFIEERLAEREIYYNRATYIADGVNLNAEKAAQILLNNYRR